MMKRWMIGLGMMVVMTCSRMGNAQMLINYNAIPNWGSGAVSGQCGLVGSTGDYWNNVKCTANTSRALLDSTGHASLLTSVTTFASGSTNDSHSTLSNPYKILYAYHQTQANGSATITISGFTGALATAKYDLYIYDQYQWGVFPAIILSMEDR
jgi:hypothetical protein